MKSDRQTYLADRPPVPLDRIPKSGTCQRDVGLAERTDAPMGSDPPKNHFARLIEYDDRMRHEERKYSRLLTELKKASWFTRNDSTCGGFIQSSPHKGDASRGFAEFDVGESPDVECDVGRMLGELVSSELETTMLTDDEVRNGCGLTMEQALLRHDKPPSLDIIDRCLERTSTQKSIAFQYTVSIRGLNISRSPVIEAIQTARSNLSESSGMKSLNVNRLRLEVGETCSNFSECDSTAAINSAGLETSRRIENWHPGSHWHQSVLPISWDSVIVESVRLVLQRWSRVYSFSSTTCCTCEKSEHEIVHFLHTGKNKST